MRFNWRMTALTFGCLASSELSMLYARCGRAAQRVLRLKINNTIKIFDNKINLLIFIKYPWIKLTKNNNDNNITFISKENLSKTFIEFVPEAVDASSSSTRMSWMMQAG
ncbi:unknown protein [Waddlia chondrophila 2032/99]|uniref:Uncharacterized protein n=1 Tax=Waddlia chondrophila 2032/99 TaxID=765953 RepID=F8LCP7_9BACT|nr:hypothetical protein [Waddlia chondrophila]CCB91261.1 unknown protein [Waddlia chondrophila 2032/99]